MPTPDSAPLLLAVDAPSLLHRNHHARAESGLVDAGGRPAWALHGMLRQILEAIDQFAPDAVLFGLDDRRAAIERGGSRDVGADKGERVTAQFGRRRDEHRRRHEPGR